MKKSTGFLSLIVVSLLITASAFGATKTFTGPGNFSDNTKWNGSTLPVAGDVLQINGACTFDNAAANLVYSNLIVGQASAGTLDWPVGGTNTLNVAAVSSTIAGSAINMTNGGTLQIRTSWTTTNQAFTAGSGTINWNVTGAASTLPAAIAIYNNLTITAATRTVTLGVATTISGDLTITTGTLASNNLGMVIAGDWTNNGTGFTAGTGIVTLDGTGVQSIGGSVATAFANLTINKASGTATAGSNFAVSNVFTLQAGIFDASSTTVTLSGAGATFVTSGGTFTASTSTLTYTNASAVTIAGGITYNNLTLAGGGVKTLGGPIVVNGNLTVSAGSLDVSASNHAIDLGGNWSSTGTFTQRSGTVTLNGTGAQSIATTNIFNNLTINKASGTATANNNFTVAAVFTLQAGTFDASSRTITLSGSGIPLVSSGGTFTSSTSTVTYTSTSGATTVGVVGYNNLTINGTGGTFSPAAGLTVGGTLIVSAGTFNASGQTIDVTGLTTVNGGTYQASTATQTLSGGFTVSSGTFTGSAGIVSTSNVTLSGGVLTAPNASGNLNVSGNWVQSSGTFNHNSGTVTLNGTGAQSVGTSAFNNLTINKTLGTASASGNFSLAGVFTIQSGTFDALTRTITLSGSGSPFVASGGTFTASTSTILYTSPTGASIGGGVTYHNLTMTSATQTFTAVANMTVSNILTVSANTTFDGSSQTVTLSGSGTPLVATGTFTASTSTVNYTSGTGAIITAVNYFNLGVGGAGTFTAASNFNVGGTMTVNAGATFTPGATVVVNSVAAGTISGSGTIQVTRTAATPDLVSQYKFTAYTLSGMTVNYSAAAAQTVNSSVSVGNYGTLQITGGSNNTKTLGGAIAVNGDLTIASATILAAGANSIDVAGTWTNNGTLTNTGAQTVTLNGIAAQSIAGSTTTAFINLTINKASGIATAGANLTVSSVFTIQAGTFDASSRAITLSGSGTPFGVTGTFTASTSTVSYTSASAVNVTGGITYNNLTVSGASTKILTGDITVGSVLTISSGTFDASSRTITLPGSGTPLVVGGTFTSSISTVNYTNAGAVVVAGTTYNNLTVSGGNTKTLNNNTVVAGDLTIGASTTFDVTTSNYSVSVGGNWNHNGTDFVERNGTVTLNGVGAQSLGGSTASTFYNLTVNKSGGTATAAANFTVSNVFTLQAGAFDAASRTITLPGTVPFSITAGTFTASTSTVSYTSTTGATIAGNVSYYNLTMAGNAIGDVFTAANNFTVANVLTIGTGSNATFDASNRVITLSGSGTPLVVNGAFTPSTSTITYTSATGANIIGGLTYYNLTVNSSGQTFTPSGAITVSNILTVAIGTTLDGSSQTITLSGAPTPLVVSGTFTPSTSTINYSNAGAVNVTGGTSYYNLTVSGGNTKTLAGNISVTGNLTIAASTTLAVSGSNYSIALAGDWTNSGAGFTRGSGTVTLNGAGPQVIGGTTATIFNNLTINNPGGSASASLNFEVAAVFTIQAGTFDATNRTITLSGSGTPFAVSGTFVRSISTVSYTSASAVTLAGGITYNNLSLSGASTKTLGANATVAGTFTISAGTFADGGFTLSANGNIVNSTSHTGGGKISLTGGSVAHSLSGAGSYTNLEMDDANGATLATNNLTVNGLLTLTSGRITTSALSVIITSTGSVSHTSGHIVGNLRKNIPIGGATSRTFEIGDATNYVPVDVAFAGGRLTAFDLTASTTVGDHSTINSPINLSLSANRYWTLTNTGTGFTTYDAIFNFVAGDLDAGADPNNFIGGKLTSGTWSSPTVGTRTPTSIQLTGLSAFSDFVAGEPAAKTWDGQGAADNWGDPLNWNPNGVPTSLNDVNITTAGVTISVDVAATTKNLTLNNATLIVAINSSQSLSVSGNLTLTSGTLNTAAAFPTVSGSVNVLNGTVGYTAASGSQTISTQTYGNMTISGGGTKTAPAALDINGTLILTAGTFVAGTNITIAGNWTNNGGTFTPGIGTVTFDGGATQTIGGSSANQTFYDVAVAKTGNLVAPTTLNVNGLTLTTGTLTSGTNLNVTGDWTNNGGTFTPGSGTVTFTGTVVDQLVNGSATSQNFNNLTITKSGKQFSTSGGIVAFDVNGILNITAGTFVAPANLNINGNFSNTGIFTTGAGTVTFGGSGAQAIPSVTFNNLVINKSAGTATPVGNIAINSDLTVTAGTLDLLSFTANRSSAGGTLTVGSAGTLNLTAITGGQTGSNFPLSFSTISLDAASTVIYVSANSVSQTIYASPVYGNLVLSKTGGAGSTTKTASGNLTILGSLTINTNVTLTAPATTSIGVDLIDGGGAVTPGAGTITFEGSGTQNITGGLGNFNNLTINKSGGNAVLSSAVTVATTLTVTAGTLNTNNLSLTVTGNTDISGTLGITAGTSGTPTFANLTVNGGGSFINNTVNDAVIINGNLQNDGTFTPGTGLYTLAGATKTISGLNPVSISSATISGSYTNNGTLTVSATLIGGGSLTQGTNATLNIGGTSTTTTLVATANPNTVNYNGGAQTVRALTYHHLILSGGNTKTLGGAIVANGNLTIASSTTLDVVSVSNFAVSVKGNWTHDGTLFNARAGTVTFNGTAAQLIGGSTGTTFYGLTINNALGVTLSRDETVSNLLTLTSGNITTGANTLIYTLASGAVTRTSGHVVGNVRKNVATGSNVQRIFEIGDATSYTPDTLLFASVTVAGSLTASTAHGDHPNIATSGINASKSVNRYHTLTNSGITFTTFNATFGFVAGDLDAGANVASFIVGRYASGWTLPTVGTKTATSTQVTGMTSFGDFAIGEVAPATYTITASAGSNGSITPSGAVNVNPGANQTFTITANSGYHVDDVVVDGISVGAVPSYTFNNVSTNHTIAASFVANLGSGNLIAWDNFNRADETPVNVLGNWRQSVAGPYQPGFANLASNRIASSNLEGIYYWGGAGTFDPTKQYARAKVNIGVGEAGLILLGAPGQGLMVTWASSTISGSLDVLYMYWYKDGQYGALAEEFMTIQPDDIVEGVLDGGQIYAKVNGVTVKVVANTSPLVIGTPGFVTYQPGATLDDWEAGTPISYTISGTITEDAVGLGGVLVTASGGLQGSATTNGSGVYTITGVAPDATGIVLTPTLVGHTMSPLTRTVAGPVTGNVSGEDFTSTANNNIVLTINATHGSVTKNPDQATYAFGTEVTLTPVADEGYHFVSWSGDVPAGHETDNPLLVTMNNDRTITANFFLPDVVAFDDFNRTNESPLTVGQNWQRILTNNSSGNGQVNLTSNQVVSTGGEAIYYWQAWTFDNTRQFARATVVSAGGQVGLVLLGGTGQALIATWTSGEVHLYWYANGEYQGNLETASSPLQDGDNIEAVLDGGTVHAKVNGAVVLTSVIPSEVLTALSSGNPGFETYLSGAVIDNWEAGTPAVEFTLTVNTANGTVSKSPDQSTYTPGTDVTLTAVPNAGYNFVNWSGDASGSTNPLVVTMTGNKNITANFAINTYTLTVNAANGTVSPSPNQATYDYGTSVQLTASPNVDHNFIDWSGDTSNTVNPLTLVMNRNWNVTANFGVSVAVATTGAYNFDNNGDATTDMTMNFSTLPANGGTISVSASLSMPPSAPANVLPYYLQITSTMPNHSFSTTVSIDMFNVAGFGATSYMMCYNTVTTSWVMVNGTYVATDAAFGGHPSFTFTTDHFTAFTFVTSATPPKNVYLGSGGNATTASVILPNTNWGSPTGYEGDPAVDWSWTGVEPVSVHLVPEVGSVFKSADVSIEWDGSVLAFASVDFTGSLFDGGNSTASYDQLLGTNRLTIHVARTDATDITAVSGDFIAKVNLTLLKPGHSAIAVIGTDFQKNDNSSVLVLPYQSEVKTYLGDVASSGDASTGDGLINFSDLSAWSLSYWSGVAGFPGGLANYRVKYDIGPTEDGFVFSKPVPDTRINFEDLVVFAISYGMNSNHQLPKIVAQSSEPPQVSLGRPVVQGNETRIPVIIEGTVADIRGMKMEINGQFGSFLGVVKGTVLQQYTTPVMVMSRAEGRTVYVDLAVVGVDVDGIKQSGDVVWLRFTGDPHVRLNSAEGRTSRNNVLNVTKKVGAGESVPRSYNLVQNYPNPFNPTTTIEYELPSAGEVSIEVYNILGARIATLVHAVQEAGFYQVQWNGKDDSNSQVATGVYLYRIRAGQFSSMKKMLLLK